MNHGSLEPRSPQRLLSSYLKIHLFDWTSCHWSCLGGYAVWRSYDSMWRVTSQLFYWSVDWSIVLLI